MNERERILDLVKKGVISSEEGLVLLENLAKKSSEAASETIHTSHPRPKFKFDDDNDTKDRHADTDEPHFFKNFFDGVDDVVEDVKDAREDAEQDAADDREDEEDAKQEAADAQQEAIEELDDQLSDLKEELAEHNESLAENERKIAAVNQQITLDQEHITVIDAMEDLDSLTDDKRQERVDAKARVVELQQTVENLDLAKKDLTAQIDELNQEISQLNRKRIKANLHFDEIRDNTSATLNDFGEKLGDFGSQLGGYVRDTVKNVVDNIDWNDVTFKVPGLATTTFKHDFIYENCGATILDIKNANGDVTLHSWGKPDIKVSASIKLYGKMDGADELTSFTDRSRINVNDDHLIFQVPNKRVQANLDIYLPARVYDHVNLRLLNGGIEASDIQAKDVYLKTTNGKISLSGLQATMIEAEDVNGTIDVDDVDLHELLLSTVNGSATVTGKIQAGKLSTVHGSVKATLTNDDLHRLEASSVNGNVKVALPASLKFSGNAKTSFGQVNTRSAELQIVDQRSTTGANVTFTRGEHPEAHIQLSSTSGSVYLKDNQ